MVAVSYESLEKSLRLFPGFSLRLTVLIVSPHLIGALVVTTLDITWPFRLLLLVLVFLSAWDAIRVHMLRRGKRGVKGAVWDADGRWWLATDAEEEASARLLPDALVHPALVVLNFRLEDGSRRSLLLFPDAVKADLLRRLRMRLKFER